MVTLYDRDLDRLLIRAAMLFDEGWTVQRPVFVHWTLRHAITLADPTPESVETRKRWSVTATPRRGASA